MQIFPPQSWYRLACHRDQCFQVSRASKYWIRANRVGQLSLPSPTSLGSGVPPPLLEISDYIQATQIISSFYSNVHLKCFLKSCQVQKKIHMYTCLPIQTRVPTHCLPLLLPQAFPRKPTVSTHQELEAIDVHP